MKGLLSKESVRGASVGDGNIQRFGFITELVG